LQSLIYKTENRIIINAVNNALQKAVVSETLPESAEPSRGSGENRENNNVNFRDGHKSPGNRNQNGASDGKRF